MEEGQLGHQSISSLPFSILSLRTSLLTLLDNVLTPLSTFNELGRRIFSSLRLKFIWYRLVSRSSEYDSGPRPRDKPVPDELEA